jgi:outer membrane protein assembly factor BamA
LSTARRYGYSISPEGGVSAGVVLEASRRALGADVDSTFSRADVRAYVPLAPRRSVLALRASAAAARGDRRGRRTARLGGADGDPGVVSFDEDASSLLRGFPANAFQGHTVALFNAEYRVPLGWPQRGVRAWPIFVRSLHATAFADVGHAWSGRFRRSELKSSWGAEISADLTAAYALPFTWTAGIAWGHDRSGRTPDNRQVYVRLGHGF